MSRGAPCTTSPPTVAEPSAGGVPTGSIAAVGELIIVSGAPSASCVALAPAATMAPPLSLVTLAVFAPLVVVVVEVPSGLVGVLPVVTSPVAMFSQMS